MIFLSVAAVVEEGTVTGESPVAVGLSASGADAIYRAKRFYDVDLNKMFLTTLNP